MAVVSLRGRLGAILSLFVLVCTGCRHPEEPYRLQLRAEDGGKVSVGVSGCVGEGYVGQITSAQVSVAPVEVNVAGDAPRWSIAPGQGGAVLVHLPDEAIDEWFTLESQGVRGTLAVRIWLRHSTGAEASHSVGVSLAEARDQIENANESVSNWCVWVGDAEASAPGDDGTRLASRDRGVADG